MKHAEQLMKTAPDSALYILQHIQPLESLSDADRALYGILYFEALDKNNQTLEPDSTINFSVNYFQNTNQEIELATAYYYKARLYKKAQKFDKATLLYLKALDIFEDSEEYYFLGKIYSDMGDICNFQKDYKESLAKYQLSLQYFRKANDSTETSYKFIDIGRVYRFSKDYKKAVHYYKDAITQSRDSFVLGTAFQEMGINYFKAQLFDSAELYLRKSLFYPYIGTSFAIRCSFLGEVYFTTNKFDSAHYYATKALKYPSTFFNQRDSYRILANTEYMRGDFNKMGKYMTKYQDCTDSVRKIEIQTKSTVLENIHETNGAFVKSKHFSFVLAGLILIVLSLSLFILFKLRNRNKNKEKQLKKVEKRLLNKQVLLKESLMLKIEETKLLKLSPNKRSTLIERDFIIREVYTACLNLNDWNLFEKLVNQTFNKLFFVLTSTYSDINRKELTLCALLLLNVPTTDMTIILDCQQGSLYKLKHRLTQKLKLTSTKDLDQLLLQLSSEN